MTVLFYLFVLEYSKSLIRETFCIYAQVIFVWFYFKGPILHLGIFGDRHTIYISGDHRWMVWNSFPGKILTLDHVQVDFLSGKLLKIRWGSENFSETRKID